MVSTSPLALRYPKTIPHHYDGIGSVSSEVTGGKTHFKIPQQFACPCSPRKYGEVAKVVFWASVRNADPTVPVVGARLRVWPASSAGVPETPDVGRIVAGSGVDGAATYGISSIGSRLFSTQGPATTIGANQSFAGAIIQVEFDPFSFADVDFFQAWNTPTTDDDYIAFNMAIAVESGNVATFQVYGFGYTVVQAPGPTNNSVTYYQMWHPKETLGSGLQDYDAANATTHDQTRGAWRFRYNNADWDNITSVNLLISYGVGSGTGGLDFRFDRVASETQAGGSTVNVVEEHYDPGGTQRYGFYRSQNLLEEMDPGADFSFDYRHTTGNVAAGGITGTPWVALEITQKNHAKTTSFFQPSAPASRALNGHIFGDLIPGLWASSTLFDPRYFANYPDEFFTKKQGFAAMVHANAANDPEAQVVMNSDLAGDANGNPPGNGLVFTATIVATMTATPTASFPRWSMQFGNISGLKDPLNFAGDRRLYYRFSGSWNAGDAGHPGVMGLLYTYTVPNTEVLDLGPLFPLGEFIPEGCASTSAGLGDPGLLVITNGASIPQKFNPLSGTIDDVGMPLPFEGEFPSGGALLVENSIFSANGGILPGRYEYRYTFRNCCTGQESDPNPDTFVIDSAVAGASPAARHLISFVGIRIPGDPQICEICIYRSVFDGGFPVMAKAGCININETTVFVDEVPDADLDFIGEPLFILNGPMPCVPVVVDYRNRLFGLGDIPQLAPAGTVSVVKGNRYVTGDAAVEWERCVEGKFLQVSRDCRAYEIERILPPEEGLSPSIGRLKLVEDYEGETGNELSYTICGHKNRLFFSEPLLPEAWPNINFLDVEPGDGDKLIGGASNFDALVICKRNKTYVLRFRENPLVEVVVPTRVSTDIGCIGPRSFAQVENATVWLSDRGIARFDGRGVMHIEESDRFNDMLINPDNPRYVRRDAQGRVIDAVGAFYPKREQYLLLLPTVQTQRGANVMLVWDTSLRNITLYEFCQEFQSMVVSKDADGNERVYLGDTNGFVWMFDVGDNDGVGFPGATGTVRGTVTSAGVEQGASFLEDVAATFIVGGLPQLAALSGTEGLTPSFGVSPDESGELGMAGACVFWRPAGAALDDPWESRTIYVSTEKRLYVTPSWGTDTPTVGDEYMIGPIDFVAQFKPANMGSDDLLKRDWEQLLTFDPVPVSSQLRVELRPDFASSDVEELTVKNADGETGDGRTFDLQLARGRIRKPLGRRIYNYMQVKMTNFAPDEPVRVLNHNLHFNPRSQ